MLKTLLLLQACFFVNAFAGQERGGGNELEREFVKMGYLAAIVIENTQKSGSDLFEGFNLDSFKLALDEVEVHALSKVCNPEMTDLSTGIVKKGRCLEARYTRGLNLIEFDEKVWVQKNCLEQLGLVMHEYGRASNNEGGNYKYSSRIDKADIKKSCDEIDRQRRARKAPAVDSNCATANQQLTDFLVQMCSHKDYYRTCLARQISNYIADVGRSCNGQGAVNACLKAAQPHLGAEAILFCSAFKNKF